MSRCYRVLGPAGKTPLLTVHGLVSSDHHWESLPRVTPPSGRSCRGSSAGTAASRRRATIAARRCSSSPTTPTRSGARRRRTGHRRGAQLRRAGRARAVAAPPGRGARHGPRLRHLPVIRSTACRARRRRRGAAGMTRALARTPAARPLLALLRSSAGRRVACELAFQSGGAHREELPARGAGRAVQARRAARSRGSWPRWRRELPGAQRRRRARPHPRADAAHRWRPR